MIQTLTALILQYKYTILIPLAFVEGPLTSMLSGALFKLGDFNILPLYLCLMAGDLLGDIFWYYVGYFWGGKFMTRFGKYLSITEKNVAAAKRIFSRHHDAIFFVSKITMGFGFALATLFTAGLIRTPFSRFFAMNILGQVIWTGVLILIGYSLGNIYIAISNSLDSLSLFGLIIITFMALAGAGTYLKNRMLQRYS